MLCKVVGGTKVLGNEKSWERSSSERKVQGTKVPSSPGTKVPENERARERKFQGTKVPHRDYSFLGTKGHVHEKSRYRSYIKEKKENFLLVDG